MRPIRLEVAGFSAFRERAEVDFEGTELVAFVGPTGSGKSSLIDAITFALYGSVSRYDDLRLVEPIIHKLANEAKVRLDFELNGQRYTAVRVVRRTKTGATTKEARLVRARSDGAEDILAGSQREMADAVAGLLGLDFEQFTRTVVLPQGDFAAFLHEGKGERQQLLRQLLEATVYDQMGRLARRRAGIASTRAELLVEQRDAVEPVTDEQLADLTRRVERLSTLQDEVAQQVAEVARLDGELEALSSSITSLELLRRALGDLAVPPAVTALGPKIDAASALERASADALQEARSTRDAAQVAAGETVDVVAVQRTLDALARVSELDGRIESGRPKVEAAAQAAREAGSRLEQAAAALATAEATLESAKDAAGLGATIAALVVGEPCPVCAQTVSTLPDHDLDAELARARAEHATAKERHGRAQTEAAEAKTNSAKLTALLDALSAEREQLAASLPSAADPGALRAQLDEAQALARAHAEALAACAQAEADHERHRQELEGLRADEAHLRQSLMAARDSIAIRQPPAPAGESLEADWLALVRWGAEQLAQVDDDLATARQAVQERAAARADLAGAVTAACAEVGVETSLDQVRQRLATEAVETRHALAAAEDRRRRRAQLEEEVTALQQQISLHAEMGRLLSASGFERWLLQTALDDLVGRATQRLLELSSGQFSLESDDGDFWIRDHRNADELRSVRTLSGGETFLASLALALALADNIAELAVEGAPRIESMFLDEGFGTLDPDTLDIVATAMEELSASGRLIGIVTHIRELADRMPVRFEVHKDTTTARVVRVEV